MKIIAGIFISILSLSTLVAQDLIVKTNGDEIQCKVIRVNPVDVVYKKKENPEGPEYTEFKANIFFIKYENGSKEIYTTLNTPLQDNAGIPSGAIKRKNSIFFDLLGNSIIASLNYERKFFTNQSYNFIAGKIGVGPFGSSSIINATATFNIGNGVSYFEVGGGAGVVIVQDNQHFIFHKTTAYFTPLVGFRRQSPGGFLFRAYMTMLTTERRNITYYDSYPYSYNYSTAYTYQYYPYVGVSLGYSF